jgi:hypothetical protein
MGRTTGLCDPLLGSPMRKRFAITAAILAGLVLVATTSKLFERRGSLLKVAPGLRAEDPAQIERAVSRDRWAQVRDSLRHPKSKSIGAPFLEISLGRVRKIGPMPDQTFSGWGQSLTNGSISTRAYATVCRRNSSKCLQYYLHRYTNGWRVDRIIYGANDSRL